MTPKFSKLVAEQNLRKAQAALTPTHGWAAIKTAPKDGRNVLLYADSSGRDYMDRGYYNDEIAISQHDSWPWRWPWTVKPTHWMPLPNPPINKTGRNH